MIEIGSVIMDQDEAFDLSSLILHNASSYSYLTSPATSPAPSQAPKVFPRPISKRRGKKRSSRACTTCRQRKVRCNIVAHGAPCSNCRHDEIECILPLSRRQRAAREKAEQNSRDSTCYTRIADRQHVTEHHEELNPNQIRASVERAQSVDDLAPHGMRVSEHPLAEIFPTTNVAPPKISSVPRASNSLRTKSWIRLESPFASAPRIPSKPLDRCLPVLPEVFAPFPRHLDTTDLTYLHSRDAITLPDETFQIELLKAYIEFVHGSMPVLDLEDFLGAIKYGCGDLDCPNAISTEQGYTNEKRISLLLFQAVMFAGLEYVPMRALKDAGFRSRGDAKSIFFNRIRLLYDFDTCTERLTLIQALLLMTLCPSKTMEKDTKDEWHWLGLAISLAFSLGINRDIPQASPNPRRRRLERRVWWAIFVRDRILALHSGTEYIRPLRIQREDCDIDMLCLEDFELDEGDNPKALRDARECVEKVALCWCSNDRVLPIFPMTYLPPPTTAPESMSAPHTIFPSSAELEQSLHIHTAEPPLVETQPSCFQRALTADTENECLVGTSTTPSIHEDCVTPGEGEQEPGAAVFASKNLLEGGYGVDGEYDDYLEFLRPSIEDNLKSSLDVTGGMQQPSKPLIEVT